MAFLSYNSSDTPGLTPLMNVLFWGRCDFPIAPRAGICKGTFEIVSNEVLLSIRGSYQTIWYPPFVNFIRFSGWWSYTVTPSITPILIWTLLPKLTFYLIARCFHRTFATGAACQHRMLTPPDTWSCSTLGQVFLYWEQSLLNLSCFRTFEFRTSLGISVLLCFLHMKLSL